MVESAPPILEQDSLEYLEHLLAKERAARGRASRAAEEAWSEMAAALRGMFRKLEETKGFLRNILDSSTEFSIIAKDLDRNIILWNEGARRYYGYEAHEVLGRRVDMLHTPEDLATGNLERIHDEALVKGKAEGRFQRRRKDGTAFPVSVVVMRRDDPEGKPVGFLVISRDITGDLELEERRLREIRLREATLVMDHERRVAQEANRVKSQFLANMSHEVRTPLNTIIGFTDLLLTGRQDPLTPRQRHHLEDVSLSARHLLRIINDVLDLAKVEAGRVTFEPKHVDAAQVARETLDSIRPAAEETGIAVRLEVPSEPLTALLDQGRLRQVMLNYLSNAVKFTGRGGKVVLRLQPEGRAWLRLEVEDDGPGIAPAQQAKLFQPFEQLDAGLAKAHEGTGLGLALTKRIVEAQGGRVGVVSEPGVGSTFWARIPLHPPRPPSPEPRAPRGGREARGGGEGRSGGEREGGDGREGAGEGGDGGEGESEDGRPEGPEGAGDEPARDRGTPHPEVSHA